jgi:hypothetical protein
VHVFYFILFDQVIDTSSARGGVLECIELSSMVDFSMGTIYLGWVHDLWSWTPARPSGRLATETDKVRSSCLSDQLEGERQSARTQVRARGDILPKAPGRSRARPSWYTGALVRE